MVKMAASLCALAGRILLSMIFLMSGVNKILDFAGTADNMRAEGMVAAPLFLIGAIAFEVGGGLMLLAGWYGRLGALLLLIFLIPVTLIFHDFWQYEGQAAMMQMMNFTKNVAIMGGLLIALAHGSGGLSVDGWRNRRKPKAA